jgi:hypothetical protein
MFEDIVAAVLFVSFGWSSFSRIWVCLVLCLPVSGFLGVVVVVLACSLVSGFLGVF